MHDVAGETPEAKRQFASEKEQGPDEDQQAAEDQQGAAEFAEGVHRRSVDEDEERDKEAGKRDEGFLTARRSVRNDATVNGEGGANCLTRCALSR